MRGAALLAALVLLPACRERPSAVEVRAELDPSRQEFGAVEVTGVPRAIRHAMRDRPADDRAWTGMLTVRIGDPAESLPPLAGHYRITDRGTLRFEPRFRPRGGLRYIVRWDPRGAAGTTAGDSARIWRFTLPSAPVPPSTTVVQAIYPGVARVPANQLRWYIEFSAPMREGEAARRLHLLDEHRREISGAFLDMRQELWDPERRRLTVLFDPGRVKRGIRLNVEIGPPIEPGHRYTLAVDSLWPDARGAGLARGFEQHFAVGPADHTSPVPARWVLRAPPRGSRMALEVDFREPLDHALAQRLLAVAGPGGSPVDGDASLDPGDRTWRFTPSEPWSAGRYQLRVHPTLEDLAGNSVQRVFDADLSAGEHATAELPAVTLAFEPQAPEPAEAPSR